MSESLFQQLKQIGIDEDMAHKVSASLDPDHNASKKDVLVLQEAILQQQARFDQRFNHQEAKSDERNNQFVQQMADIQAKADERHNQFIQRMSELQARTDARYFELKSEMINGFVDVRNEITDVCSEMHAMNRQFIFAFGGMIVTILRVEEEQNLPDSPDDAASSTGSDVGTGNFATAATLSVLAINIYFH